MPLDIVELKNFYASPLGEVTYRMLGAAIRSRMPSLRGRCVLGLGYATPYLDLIKEDAERVFAVMPDVQGVTPWPTAGHLGSVLSSTSDLPFADASIDTVLLTHALETDDSPRTMLSEIWRVLTPGGSLIVTVPNRRGLWARMDTTPFGYGEPYSRRQINSLLLETLFSPTGWVEALHFPPLQSQALLKSARALERIGEKLGLPFAGVHVIVATKLLYRPILASKSARQKARLRPVLVPSASPRLDEIPQQGH